MRREDLYITIPSFFRCPISLDVMKSPVSLSTGVTYDRTNIQRWLDSGHNTCPATMQTLPPSPHFVPNHTLHRLIHLWLSAQPNPKPGPEPEPISPHGAQQLIDLILANNKQYYTLKSLLNLLSFASQSPENTKLLSSNQPFVDLLTRVVVVSGFGSDPDVLEPSLKLLHVVLSSSSPPITAVTIGKKHPGFFKSIARILKTGQPDSVLAVLGILRILATDPDSKRVVLEDENNVLQTMLYMVKSFAMHGSNSSLCGVLLSTLVFLSSPRRNKLKVVTNGGVRIMGKIIRSTESTAELIELAMTQLEMLAGSVEGRAAIGEDYEVVAGVVDKLMVVSKAGKEHGVALLWSLCYLFRDHKAKEGVMKSNGGLKKILLLMQSDCSPAVKRMCSDLLRIFWVNSKSCLTSYDSKTTHIMPF